MFPGQRSERWEFIYEIDCAPEEALLKRLSYGRLDATSSIQEEAADMVAVEEGRPESGRFISPNEIRSIWRLRSVRVNSHSNHPF